ncbi:uncharacterized protein LOC119688900 isoform X2 [Teleopsis dalmanni]|uniref:uncharacterized protein LOC119688900 isoform X2 n=1 Tax=Teleopsis dalmanni TaxID=139649 RepID=UPI0018CEA8E4|nr:uncharacterized protein LOC119688900 isoform X2 [Teleopsis dalmanni]
MEDQQNLKRNNMISNLPLLFASGYPTSLQRITEKQLESFIPFMVQCSLGYINLQGKIDASEPEWWPEDVTYTVPFIKPKKFVGDWLGKMKEIVIICYQFHKSVFLLRFCDDLASYEQTSLRFINNYNSTTSLFDRRNNKLLVTFRNENMSYDQQHRYRKTLLQAKSKQDHHEKRMSTNVMVEPAPFDIYLCDHCDAELYSKEAMQEHEKTCFDDDDDVILCDTPEPMNDNQEELEPSNSIESNEQRNMFLLNFGLISDEALKLNNVKQHDSPAKDDFMILHKTKHLPRRNRAVQSLARCPTIPLTSPAGELLIRTTKANVTTDYISERFDRLDRFCQAPLLLKGLQRPKYFDKKCLSSNTHVTYKKQQDVGSHVYSFPRRQYSQRQRKEDLDFFNGELIKHCRPIAVRIKKINDQEVKQTDESPMDIDTKFNIKQIWENNDNADYKKSTANQILVDTIDLCSSDEDEDGVKTNSHSNKTITAHLVNSNIIVNTSSAVHKELNTTKVVLNNARTLSVASQCVNNNEQPTLTVFRKSLTNSAKIRLGTPVMKVKPFAVNNDKVTNNTPPYEGAVLLTPPTASPSTSSTIISTTPIATALLTTETPNVTNVLPRPLGPSMYIFSNYTATTPLTAFVAAPNNFLSSNMEGTNFHNYNQENRMQKTTGTIIAKKHTLC